MPLLNLKTSQNKFKIVNFRSNSINRFQTFLLILYYIILITKG